MQKSAGNILNLKNVNKFLFVLIIITGIYYVALINASSVKGFTLVDLKARRDGLARANYRLELEAATLSSYGSVSKRISDLRMVAVGSIDYINAGAEFVAKK